MSVAELDPTASVTDDLEAEQPEPEISEPPDSTGELDAAGYPPGEEAEASLRRIAAAERTVAEREREHNEAREEASDRKKVLEAAMDELRRVIREETRPPDLPLFHRAGAEMSPADAPDDLAPDPDLDPAPDDSWRRTPLADLGLSDGLLDLLAEHDPPLTTLGELADHTRDNDGIRVAGIGKAKAERVQAAVDAFWLRWAAEGREPGPDAGDGPQAAPEPPGDAAEGADGG